MDSRALRVVADDLTGACDIAAALLPWSSPVLVQSYAGAAAPTEAGLWVRNTQSRTLAAADARRAVGAALAGAAAEQAVVLKKIDTALRGHMGAELDAAIDAAGAAEAFILLAIPAVSRTTVGGVQLIDGVPVHRTAFAQDPLHPVDRSDVAAHVERGTARRCRALLLETIRSPTAMRAAIEQGRRDGCTTFVCDAASDDDLDQALSVLLERPRPIVLAGSLGLGHAVRRRLALPAATAPSGIRRSPGPALVVVGSAHPAARRQHQAIDAGAAYVVGDREDADITGRQAAATLAGGATAVLCTPPDVGARDSGRVLEAIARAVASCVADCRPRRLALVGGETAHAVLRALGQPAIRIVTALEPLIVGGELAGGALAGTPLVTKGGSSGDAGSLARALAWMAEGR